MLSNKKTIKLTKPQNIKKLKNEPLKNISKFPTKPTKKNETLELHFLKKKKIKIKSQIL
jgi:hypothetical protein